MDCLVLVPTYNESQSLPELVRRLFALELPGLEMLVIDDASPDGTGVLAEELSSQYGGRIHLLARTGKEGLGPAYLAGYHAAVEMGAEYVVQMDADLSHPPELIPKLLERIQGCDVVIASRYVEGGGVDPTWSLLRRLISRGGNVYTSLVTGIPIRDATSGFRCFRRHSLERLDVTRLRCRNFGFQVEVAYQCWKNELRIEEVPYTFMERASGVSKMTAGTAVEALWRVIQLRLGR